MWQCNRFVAHDGSEGLSPDGWLPDRISIGVLTRAFPPELVDGVVEATGAGEQRRLQHQTRPVYAMRLPGCCADYVVRHRAPAPVAARAWSPHRGNHDG
jgi:hypothetical protein